MEMYFAGTVLLADCFDHAPLSPGFVEAVGDSGRRA